jgi:hypothetical protein
MRRVSHYAQYHLRSSGVFGCDPASGFDTVGVCGSNPHVPIYPFPFHLQVFSPPSPVRFQPQHPRNFPGFFPTPPRIQLPRAVLLARGPDSAGRALPPVRPGRGERHPRPLRAARRERAARGLPSADVVPDQTRRDALAAQVTVNGVVAQALTVVSEVRQRVVVNLTPFSGEVDKTIFGPHAACFNCAW